MSVHNDVVTAMCNFARPIFQQSFIESPEVQMIVAEMLVNDPALVEINGQMSNMIGSLMNVAMEGDDGFFDTKRPLVTISVGLTAEEKSMLINANPDVQIKVNEAPHMPHGVAYAQRIVDTSRVTAKLQIKPGVPFIDIGGNQKHWASTKHAEFVHACMLWNGEVEMHRQVQRIVAMETTGITPVGHCTAGVQNCTVQSKFGVSIHAISDIDPRIWDDIFAVHGLEQVVAVFHYDYAMETDEVGFMPGVGMHWFLRGDRVIFHFDNDSSHEYDHNVDWLRTYATDHFITSDRYDFTVYSQVNFVHGGRAQITMTKMMKDTLGVQESMPQFRYFNVDPVMQLFVPKFDESTGKAISDPRAYVVKQVDVPMPLYNYVYQAGVSNDSDRPDKPLTFDYVRGLVQSFNYIRRVNRTDITTPIKLRAEVIEDIALGMYLVVVQSVAATKAAIGSYTTSMRTLQQRWGYENAIVLMTKAISGAMLTPFLLLAESFEEQVAVVHAHMRSYIRTSTVTAHAYEQCLYRQLPDVVPLDGSANQPFHPFDPQFDNVHHEEVSAKEFFDIFKDVMPEDQRDVLKQYVDDLPAEDVITVTTNTHRDKEYGLPTNREEWLQLYSDFRDMEGVRNALTEVIDTEVADNVDPKRVWDNYAETVLEYALYCTDVAFHAIAAAVAVTQDTWTSSGPSLDRLHKVNVTRDLSAKYFAVGVDGLLDMRLDDRHDCVVDPVTHKHHKVFVRGDSCFVTDVKSDYVFSMESLRVFNHLQIAKRAFAMYPELVKGPPNAEACLIDGVPGCGKTYRIIQDFGMNSLIVTTVKSTSESTTDDLAVDKRFARFGKKKVSGRVRTNDSANMHGVPLADAVMADEGLMAHSGALLMALHESKAKKLVVYGDSRQIGFIDRGSKLGTLALDSLLFWTAITEVNESVRCPADAIMICSLFYPEKRRPLIKTLSPVMRSIVFEHVPDVEDAAYNTPVVPYRYYSLLRADMGKTKKLVGFTDIKGFTGSDFALPRPVGSVHEVQGATVAFGCAFRRNIFNPTIFSSEQHLCVMFSRHTLRFVYRSPCGPSDDLASKMALMAQSASDDMLRSYMLDTPAWLQERMLKQSKDYSAYM